MKKVIMFIVISLLPLVVLAQQIPRRESTNTIEYNSGSAYDYSPSEEYPTTYLNQFNSYWQEREEEAYQEKQENFARRNAYRQTQQTNFLENTKEKQTRNSLNSEKNEMRKKTNRGGYTPNLLATD